MDLSRFAPALQLLRRLAQRPLSLRVNLALYGLAAAGLLYLLLVGPAWTRHVHAQAVRHLEGAGYTRVHLTGRRWFACSDDDTQRVGFRALGANGAPVSGTVCGRFLKGSTIRLD